MMVAQREKPPVPRITITIVALIALMLLALAKYYQMPISKGKSTFYLTSSYAPTILKNLKENGYDISIFDHVALMSAPSPIRGWYKVEEDEMGRLAFFEKLHLMEANTINIVVYAGDTKEEIFRRIAHDMRLDRKKLATHYKTYAHLKEGSILSGNYTLPRSADEEAVMRYILHESHKELNFFAIEQFNSDYNKTQLFEALIVASIIQKESNDIKEMSYISSVIQNRLDRGMKLQMDSTLNYGKYSHTIVTPERIRNDKSRYNTYKYKGLPPAPLGSVSIHALEAAAFPRESDYLFFVLNKNGKHNFANSYKEHLKNVKSFKSYLRERDQKKRDAKLAKSKKEEAVVNKSKREMMTITLEQNSSKVVQNIDTSSLIADTKSATGSQQESLVTSKK